MGKEYHINPFTRKQRYIPLHNTSPSPMRISSTIKNPNPNQNRPLPSPPRHVSHSRRSNERLLRQQIKKAFATAQPLPQLAMADPIYENTRYGPKYENLYPNAEPLYQNTPYQMEPLYENLNVYIPPPQAKPVTLRRRHARFKPQFSPIREE